MLGYLDKQTSSASAGIIYTVALFLAASVYAAEAPNDILPDSQPGVGQHDITYAWLVAPTTRYEHGVLGDKLEAAGLEIQLRDGTHLRVKLTTDVFEDLLPRVQDLDDDGRDEIILVRSNPQKGARISIWNIRQRQLQEIAQGPDIGHSQRWLNPIGAADFDGDKRTEIAYVQTPHIGGILRIFEYRAGKLQEEYQAQGFSNHRIGSTDLSSLHSIDDYNGDGVPDLRIMDAQRLRYRTMSIRQGQLIELSEVPATGADSPLKSVAEQK